jgi:hypothetical protein
MNPDKPPTDVAERDAPGYPLLERITAFVLMLVVAALSWMVLAACYPAWDWRLSLDAQVGLVLAVLTVALVLVSVVALLHTRS